MGTMNVYKRRDGSYKVSLRLPNALLTRCKRLVLANERSQYPEDAGC